MPEEEPKSIRALFTDAERLRNDLSNVYDTNDATFQDKLFNAIATYESCLKLSEQVSLFSPNESLEDISSSDLQYVSPLYHPHVSLSQTHIFLSLSFLSFSHHHAPPPNPAIPSFFVFPNSINISPSHANTPPTPFCTGTCPSPTTWPS